MSISIAKFRMMLVASLIIGLASSLVDMLVPGLNPPEVDEQTAQVYASGKVVGLIALVLTGLLVFALGVASFIGLLLLQRWARGMALLCSVLSLAMYPFLGAMVFSGFGAAMFYASAALWGAALAVCYWSPLEAQFKPTRG